MKGISVWDRFGSFNNTGVLRPIALSVITLMLFSAIVRGGERGRGIEDRLEVQVQGRNLERLER